MHIRSKTLSCSKNYTTTKKRKLLSDVSGRPAEVECGIRWEAIRNKPQTLFAVKVFINDPNTPNGKAECPILAAWTNVPINPYPVIRILKRDGTPYHVEESVSVSLVDTRTGEPISSESGTCRIPSLFPLPNGSIFSVKDGLLELDNLIIACQTGFHNFLSLKLEFVGEGSVFLGKIFYSSPICVNDLEVLPLFQEIAEILTKLNLQEYLNIFLCHEIDMQAFLSLEEHSLKEMGVPSGPLETILMEIATLQTQL